MPYVIEATSPETGVTHTISFDSEPSEEGLNNAVHQADGPILAQNRLKQDKMLSDLVGGQILNPITTNPVYNPDQRQADLMSVRHKILSDQQDQAQVEGDKLASEQANIDKTGKLASAYYGAASVPMGLANLGGNIIQNAASKVVGNNPSEDLKPLMNKLALEQGVREIESRAAVNPISGTAGAVAANLPLILSGGGSLGQASLGQLASSAGKGAVANAAIGSGLRKLSGGDVTPGSLAIDAALGGALGVRSSGQPIEANLIKPGDTITPNTTYLEDLKNIGAKAVSPVTKAYNSFNPDQFNALTQAIRPANKIGLKWNKDFVGDGMSAIKDLGGTPVTDVTSLVQGAKNAKQQLYGIIRSVTNNPNAVDIEGGPIMDKVLNSIANDKTLAERPQDIRAIMNNMQVYNRDIPLEEAERLLTQTNEELFGPLYNRTAAGQKIARSDLEVKAQEALAKGLRENIDQALEDQLGPEGAKIKKVYGSVSTIQAEAEKRYLVALRQAQQSLPEQLGHASSAADLLDAIGNLAAGNGGIATGKVLSAFGRSTVAKFIRQKHSTDNLIKSAFNKTESGQSPYTGMETAPPTPAPTYTPEDINYAIKKRNALRQKQRESDKSILTSDD